MAFAITAVAPSTATLDGASNTLQLTGGVVTGGTTNLTDWSSSSAAIASVDQNGLVTPHKAGGPVTITAMADENHGTTSTAAITVIGKSVLVGTKRQVLLQTLLAQRVQDLAATSGRDAVEIDNAKLALAEVQAAV